MERNFEIIGEAMRRLTRHDTTMANRILDGKEIVAFRNVLIHAYDDIDHFRVWQVIERHLPVLISEIDVAIGLLGQTNREMGST